MQEESLNLSIQPAGSGWRFSGPWHHEGAITLWTPWEHIYPDGQFLTGDGNTLHASVLYLLAFNILRPGLPWTTPYAEFKEQSAQQCYNSLGDDRKINHSG